MTPKADLSGAIWLH